MSAQNPQSEGLAQDTLKNTTKEASNLTEDFSQIPRSALGTVNDAGEVVNQAGESVGKITDSKNPQELVGNAVTATGDVVNSTGDVLGNALLDDNASEYTTESQADKGEQGEKQSKGGLLSGVGNTVGGVTKTVGGVTKGLGGLTGSGKGQESAQTKSETNFDGEDEQQEEQQVGDDTGHLKTGDQDREITSSPLQMEDRTQESIPQDTPGTSNVAETAKDKAEETSDDVNKTTEETTDDTKAQAEDVKETAEEAADDTKAQAEDVPSQGEDAAQEAGDKINDTTETAKEEAGETADEPTAKAEDTTEAAKDQVDEAPEEAKENVDETTEEAKEQAEDALDFSILKGTTVNKAGNLVDEDGRIIGRVSSGEVKDLLGKSCDEKGQIWNNAGKVIGNAEPISESERDDLNKATAPFENFVDAIVEADGRVLFEGKQVGTVVEGDAKKLKGSKIDADGDILDKKGNVVGKAAPWDEPEPEAEVEVEKDLSALAGTKVNKAGNVVDDNGRILGRITDGEVKDLIGKSVDKKGQIWSNAGEVIGHAELIPESERDDLNKSSGPFENFPDAIVEADGKVMYEGKQVGTVVEGDAKKLKGSKVDADGDILDKKGNVVGKAETYDEPEPEPEQEQDLSALAGKRVNKLGNVVSSSGEIYGRVVEGNAKSMVGRMCDKKGNILSESGDIIGRAELVSEGEREGAKEGPFAELKGLTVGKDGKVVTPAGDVVGRLTQGDGKKLSGRSVDEDGDILDSNGNVLGKAERWEEPEVEKKKGPMAGLKVNREGNVCDENGNIVGKLTSGEVGICAGKEVDDDGDVVNSKGNTVGHVNLLADIPEPEPEPEVESEEDKKKRELAENDQKLAGQLGAAVDQALDRIRPICKRISQKIDAAERQSKEDLDEEQLVKEVKPLLEDGNQILTETNGVIRGMDPDGRIQRNAKHKSNTRDATPEEHHLAEVLKELTGTVSECIDNGKRKIEGMPHAKKELNPLWGLLAEPLGQILAAVGLLLNGVLGLVGKLLSGLGLGGLVDNLLGSLGISNILQGLGLGDALGSLTGKKKGKK